MRPGVSNQSRRRRRAGADLKNAGGMFARIQAVVRKIPKGKVATYGGVAKAAGYPGAARQVVWALRAAARGLPWHRVLGAKGRILLPGENGFEQRLRLQVEGVAFIGDRVDIRRHEFRCPKRRATKAAVQK